MVKPTAGCISNLTILFRYKGRRGGDEESRDDKLNVSLLRCISSNPPCKRFKHKTTALFSSPSLEGSNNRINLLR